MSERENNVYKAKLAEQAERYDGELKVAVLLRENWKVQSGDAKKFFFHQWLPKGSNEKLKCCKSTKNRSNTPKKRSGLFKKFVLNRQELNCVAIAVEKTARDVKNDKNCFKNRVFSFSCASPRDFAIETLSRRD